MNRNSNTTDHETPRHAKKRHYHCCANDASRGCWNNCVCDCSDINRAWVCPECDDIDIAAALNAMEQILGLEAN